MFKNNTLERREDQDADGKPQNDSVNLSVLLTLTYATHSSNVSTVVFESFFQYSELTSSGKFMQSSE